MRYNPKAFLLQHSPFILNVCSIKSFSVKYNYTCSCYTEWITYEHIWHLCGCDSVIVCTDCMELEWKLPVAARIVEHGSMWLIKFYLTLMMPLSTVFDHQSNQIMRGKEQRIAHAYCGKISAIFLQRWKKYTSWCTNIGQGINIIHCSEHTHTHIQTLKC